MQVQSSRTKVPLSRVPIRRLEVGACPFLRRLNVPTPASLVRDQWPTVIDTHGVLPPAAIRSGNPSYKIRIFLNGV